MIYKIMRIAILAPTGKYISVTLQSHLYADALRKLGHTVHELNIFEPMKRDDYDLKIFYPFHYWKWRFDERSILVGIADNDKFRQDIIDNVRDLPYKKFVSISNFTKQVFKDMPRNQVVYPCLNPAVKSYPIKQPKYDTLVIGTTMPYRRGTDTAFTALNMYNNVAPRKISTLVIDHSYIPMPSEYMVQIAKQLPESEHYRNMSSARTLIHPARGGGFEIPVLEFLGMGGTVIIPDAKPFNEIPIRREDAYYVPVLGKKEGEKILNWQGDQYHIGKFYVIDPYDVYDVLKEAVKAPLQIDTGKYFEKFSPMNIAKRLIA